MPAYHRLTLVPAAAVLILAAGCSTVVTTNEFSGLFLGESGTRPLAHIHSDIWGIYFLGFESCPVITGSKSKPGRFHFFRHTASTAAAAEMVMEESRKLGADSVLNLKTDWDSSWQAYTLIFWLKEAQASGSAVLLGREAEEPELEPSGDGTEVR
jgi:hypothetical protein